MKYVIAIIAMLVTVSCTAKNADFEDSKAAFASGDYAAALPELRSLADRGNAQAQYNLGALLLKGWGVAQDEIEAAILFQRAAKQGYFEAQKILSDIYLLGKGVAQNDRLAAKWYQRAAEQGHIHARNNLNMLLGGTLG